ncbi:hypothetical protein [Flavobacterium sp. I3-2]|uniref:hypothetical protein n=1 Tax=Flavobacterium sp. I3-2 TaxID=2748319 RepID=UPI0015AC3980|nr:hypothetical protein [Flavobacterium sp. I3-2]
MKKTFFILFATVALFSCNKEVKNQTVTIENRYSLELPEFLSQTTILNKEASLQYMDETNQLFIAVIDEPISTFQEVLETDNLTDSYSNDLSGYSSLVLDTFKENVSVTYISDSEETIINEMPAILYNIKAKVGPTTAYYNFAYLKGKDTYYQIFTWTAENKESEHKEKMKSMINSIKEL